MIGYRRIAAVLVGCALAGGCGYSTSLHVPERRGSVGFEFFGNDSYERDLERPFDDQLTLAFRSLVDAPLVDVAQADVIVRGTIHSYYRRSGIRSPQNELLETGVTIEVTAALFDRASGKRLSEDHKAISSVGYLVDPQSENELDAKNRALRHIADEIVLDLFAPAK